MRRAPSTSCTPGRSRSRPGHRAVVHRQVGGTGHGPTCLGWSGPFPAPAQPVRTHDPGRSPMPVRPRTVLLISVGVAVVLLGSLVVFLSVVGLDGVA
ncbi:hypothetical protein NKG05_10515 [Oerskovia sp. M15]